MRATVDHASALAALHAQSFAKAWSVDDITDHIARDLVLTNDALTAFLIIREGGGQAEILTICTHPDARGQGAAKALLAEATPRLSSSVLFLEVAEDNVPAIALYRGLGFTPFGRRPDYYRRTGPDGQAVRIDALLFEKRLDPR